MHRCTGLLVAIVLVVTITGLPAPVGAEERVDHGDEGFTIHDNGTFAGPAGGVVGVDQSVHLHPVDERVNTGSYKSYGFLVDPPADKDASYEITVEYDTQAGERVAGRNLCAAELHMRLVGPGGDVVDGETRNCIDDLGASNNLIDSGVYELEVWTSETSLAPTEFSVEIDVDYS